MALDPSSAEAFAARGLVRMNMWDLKGAKIDLERAVTVAPGSAWVVRFYGHMLQAFGRQEEALSAYRRAVDLDPLFTASWSWLAWAYLNHMEYSAARSAFQRALELKADDINLWGVTWSYLLEGHLDLAVTWSGKIKDEENRVWARAAIEHALGHRAKARAALDSLIEKIGAKNPYGIAEHYAWRGELDRAFEWLDRAYEAHDIGYLKVDMALKPLHGDPRWAAFLKRMNLPVD